MNSLFALFRTGAWVSATLVLRSKNPVHCVFYLVLVFLHASGLLCLLGLEYFALLQLLVYVGALAVMFLFVVMLLDIPATEIVAYQRGTYPVAGILLFCLILACFYAILSPREERNLNAPILPLLTVESLRPGLTDQSYNPLFSSTEISWKNLADASTPVAQLGVALYAVHVDLLIVASLVLLVAMVGAVALTLKRRVKAPVHDVFAQHNRDFQKVVCTVTQSNSTNV